MEKRAEVDHEVHELIARRWSPRAFAEPGVEAETLSSLLEAARWAASSYNEQPWRFIVARREDEEDFEKMLACLVPMNQSWAKNAAVLLISVASLHFERNGKTNRHALHDTGQAVAQLALQATSMGLVVHQMAGFDAERVRQSYGVPEAYEPVAAIAVGYPGDAESLPPELRERELAPRPRKPQAELVFAGSWRQVWSGAAGP